MSAGPIRRVDIHRMDGNGKIVNGSHEILRFNPAIASLRDMARFIKDEFRGLEKSGNRKILANTDGSSFFAAGYNVIDIRIDFFPATIAHWDGHSNGVPGTVLTDYNFQNCIQKMKDLAGAVINVTITRNGNPDDLLTNDNDE